MNQGEEAQERVQAGREEERNGGLQACLEAVHKATDIVTSTPQFSGASSNPPQGRQGTCRKCKPWGRE